MPIRKILLATDGSPNAHCGLEIVLAGPWAAETMFAVVTVADKTSGVGHLDFAEATALAAQVEQRLQSVYGAQRVEAQVLAGQAVDSILRASQSTSADLLVIGSHSKHTPLETLVIGNVAKALAGKSQTSILLAQKHSPSLLSRILICLDGAETNERIIDNVSSLDWAESTQFLLLHIFQPPISEYGPSVAQDKRFFMEANRKANAGSETFLNESAARLRQSLGKKSEVMTMVVEDVLVAPAIIDICIKWEADLVLLGPGRHTGADHLLVGSTLQDVVKQVPCSVQLEKFA